jgi:hypothetical protein
LLDLLRVPTSRASLNELIGVPAADQPGFAGVLDSLVRAGILNDAAGYRSAAAV